MATRLDLPITSFAARDAREAQAYAVLCWPITVRGDSRESQFVPWGWQGPGAMP